jgi:hypothetical protein
MFLIKRHTPPHSHKMATSEKMKTSHILRVAIAMVENNEAWKMDVVAPKFQHHPIHIQPQKQKSFSHWPHGKCPMFGDVDVLVHTILVKVNDWWKCIWCLTPSFEGQVPHQLLMANSLWL